MGEISSVTIKLGEDDKEIKDFLSEQTNVSYAVKVALQEFIQVHGVSFVVMKKNDIPSQKEIEDKMFEYLYTKNKSTRVSDIYIYLAEEFQLSKEQLSQTTSIGENKFKKRVRFAILSLKNKGVIFSEERGFWNISKDVYTIMNKLGIKTLEDLQTTMNANYVYNLVNNISENL